MSRIKIEDLPVIGAMDAAEAAGTIGGARYNFQPAPRYNFAPQPRFNPGYFNPGNRFLPGNDGGGAPFRRY